MKAVVQSFRYTNFVLFLTVLVIIIGVLWGPIGLHNTPNNGEQWILIRVSENGENLVPARDWPTRPLRWIPYLLSFQLAPDSLVGFNIVLIVLFALRGIFTYLLFTQLFPDQPHIWFVTAITFLIYPTGTGFFNFNTINLQVALDLGLMAIYALLLYWRTNKQWLWVFILSAQILSLLIYELYYLVFAIVPILFWWIDRKLTFSRRFIQTTALWYTSCALLGVRFVSIIFGGSSDYVSSLLDTKLEEESFIDSAIYAVPRLYSNHVIAWQETLWHLDRNTSYFGMTLLGGLLIGLVVWFLQVPEDESVKSPSIQTRDYVFSIAYTILFMFLAFFIYIPVFKTFEGWRTYFVASLGAAFLTALVLHWFLALYSPLKRILLSSTLALLVIIGTNYHLIALQKVANDTTREKRLLANIVEQVPATDQAIIVVDNQEIYHQNLFWATGLNDSLSYIYDKPTDAWLCKLNPTARVHCDFGEDEIVVTVQNWANKIVYNYDEVIVFYALDETLLYMFEDMQYLAGEAHPTYQPHNLITGQAYPTRAYTYFDCFPLSECVTHPLVTELRLDFDEPVDGENWSLPSPNGQTWTVGKQALLYLPLQNNQTYSLEFAVTTYKPDILEGVHVQINDTPIALTHTKRDGFTIFSGTIPVDGLNQHNCLIVMTDDTFTPFEMGLGNDTRELGLFFDWLEIKPVSD